MNKFPSISIIIPTYNSEKTICYTLDKFINLAYLKLEIIIIDGKSSDKTLEFIEKYNDKLNCIIVSEKDGGIYNAMNKGISLASGDWLFFLGSDDLITQDFSKVIAFFGDSNTVYYSNVLFINRNIIYDGKFNSLKLTKRNLPHQAIFYPKSVFSYYRFNEKYKLKADYDLNIRLFNDKKFKFEYLDFVITEYNDRGLSGSNNDQEFEEDKYSIIKSNFPFCIFLYFVTRSSLVKFVRFIKNCF